MPSSVVDTLADLYRAFVDERRVAYVKNVATAHAMVTASYGNACGTSRNPFVNNCGFDLAGTALRHIYGSLSPPTVATGKIVRFDQTEYVGRDVVHGLDERGYLYVPSGCTTDARCRLHIAFHGCLQNAEAVGDAFYSHAGYNEWAEANGIVVLYPQAAPVLKRVIGMPLEWPNPQGCWDWWGFTGENYATKSGMQIGAINAMIDRLAGKTAPSAAPAPSPVCH